MRIAFLLGLLPALAFGQTLTLDVSGPPAVNSGNCGQTAQVTWTLSATGITCSPGFQIWATTAACATSGPAAGDFKIFGPSTATPQQTGTADLPIDSLPIFDGGVCGDARDATVNICGTYTSNQVACGLNDQTISANPSPTLRYDTLPPPAPTITKVSSLDGALSVRVDPGANAGTDVVSVTVQVRPQGSGSFVDAQTYDATAGGTSVSGLSNGTTYEVRAFVTDEAGNDSDDSTVASGTPAPTEGFWAAYQQAGGKETGGCGVAGPSAVALLLIAAALWRARRVR